MRLTCLLASVALLTLVSISASADDAKSIQDAIAAAKGTWTYSSSRRPTVPAVQNPAWVRNPIDAFILAKLDAAKLAPSAEADKLTLLRRITFDLTGLPPTTTEQDAYLADNSSNAYEKVVERLLNSKHYGERWAQHWLDLVRYAETDGFKADDHRPNAYKYRDYVIQALNNDLPYDRFIQQQLAGDELEPNNPTALIATGFNRLWPDEYNAANLEQRRQEILDDMTEVTGLVFMGLTIGCARCHDHKFDPITHADHYRLQAFFAPMLPRDDLVVATAEEQRRYTEQMKEWETATAPLRSEMKALLGDKPEQQRKDALTKFRKEIQDAVRIAEEKRTPFEQQIAQMALQQIDRAERDAPAKMAADKKKRYQELEKEMAKVARPKPPGLPGVMAVTDVGVTAPPVHRLANGDWRRPKEEVQPGFPLVLDRSHLAPRDEPIPRSEMATLPTTGRRTALAKWLTRPDHPLTARVMVNRLWHHHFGKGIVATPNDFGKQGTPPTHPELLDWLAVEFVEHGWGLKHMHRLMVTSATYRQSSKAEGGRGKAESKPLNGERGTRNAEQGVTVPPSAFRLPPSDPENALLSHARRRRLDGESLRDAMLVISGELNPRMHGPSAKPKLPDKISSYAWKPDAKPEDQHRRSIYVLAKRNMRYPLFDAFDLPDMHNSCACRPQTITAPQALLMLNSDLTLERAAAWAKSLRAQHSEYHPALITAAYRTAFARRPDKDELDLAQRFIEQQGKLLKSSDAAVADFCHALLNTNEFGWVD